MNSNVKLFAGIAGKNPTLFRRLRVSLGDPAAWIQTNDSSVAIVRDLEMDRVRQNSSADRVQCPADFPPPNGLDADRETATAQALAQYCQQNGFSQVTVDRTFPYIFAWHLSQLDIAVHYDSDLGVVDRRQKTEQEIDWLTEAQAVTEDVMRMICETIARSETNAEGHLLHEGEPLTSERARMMAAQAFMRRDYSMSHGAIVATAPLVADCHHSGSGPLKTSCPIVVDLFPMNNQTRYWGDCTRTVVHGEPNDEVKRMHQAVLAAKAAASKQLVPGNTAETVHHASDQQLIAAGYKSSRGTITDEPSIQHGTGHGIGLDVHEPILLDDGGGEMLEREVFTIEPGLYGRRDGGVRVEDMLVARAGQPQNLNRLHEGLSWK